MEFTTTALPEVRLIRPVRHGDSRGYFAETWNRETLRAHGLELDFVQDNQSRSATPYTLRGLHIQRPPYMQAKLVRVLKGRIYDVAVDIRRGSPTFGRHVGVELTADGLEQLLVPRGFLHGFVTLEPNTEVFYKVDNRYAPDHDTGVRWNDPDLAIAWPLQAATEPVLSAKDRALPGFAELAATDPFRDDV